MKWFYETVVLLRDLLAEDGRIYVHLDWHVGHYAKAASDEVFGPDRFLSEVVWLRSSSTGSSKALSRKFPSNHDVVLLYSKTERYTYERQFKPYNEEYLSQFKYDDGDGKGLYRISDLNTYSQATLNPAESRGCAAHAKGVGRQLQLQTVPN